MVCLPMDVLMKYKISQEDVLRQIDSEQMRNVTFEIASRANSHLKKVNILVVDSCVKDTPPLYKLLWDIRIK